MEDKKGAISLIHVITLTEGLGEEVRTEMKGHGFSNIEVKEIALSKYGSPVFDRSVLRQLTKAALEEHDVKDIRYLLAHCAIIAEVLSRPENNLVWAQTPSAGVDALFKTMGENLKMKDGFVMTRTSGTDRGQMLAEYVIGHILARERRIVLSAEYQKESKYERQGLSSYRMLSDLTIGILGLGNIGSEIARSCKVMKMTVWAALRDERFESETPDLDYVDHARPISRLNEFLEACDYIACVLPSTPDTRGFLSGEVLKPCSARKTVLINGGRGDLIDDESLINAVKQGWIGGAILDVQNQEPLPSDSPLWSLPGVTITPHVSCLYKNSSSMVGRLYVDNLRRYIKGEQLTNKVDFSKGY